MRVRVITAPIALGFACLTAVAQRHPLWSSIDLKVAEASQVFVGHIVEMGQMNGNPEQNNARQPVVLAVDEILKGDPVSQWHTTVGYDLWQQLDRQKILCRACPEHLHRILVTIRPAAEWATSMTDVDSSSVLDVTSDLRVLRGGAAILEAVREEIRRQPGVIDGKAVFGWGPSETFMPGTPFHGCTVYVPVDERQEQLAHRILASQRAPASVTYYEANDRSNAVVALKFFQSPANVQLLESLLRDQQVEHAALGDVDYPVRIEAFQVLTQWGVDVPKPTTIVKIQEPWDGKLPSDSR